jgi:hypothetical protein
MAAKKGWNTVALRDIVERIFYPGRFKRLYVDRAPDAVPFFGGSNITELITETDKWLGPDDPHLDQLRVRTGWVLITRSGSTGIVSSVPPAWDGVAMSEHVIRIVPDSKKLPGEYIQAFLLTAYAQDMLAKGVFGSVIDEITPEFIGGLQMPVPKSKQILTKIVDTVRRSEESRQMTLGHLRNAVESLEKELAR